MQANRDRKARGIALITTMMIMALLITLVGAFVTVNASSSRLTGNALQRRIAQDACLSALNLAWSRLEANPRWGDKDAGLFPTTSPVVFPNPNPRMRVATGVDSRSNSVMTGAIDDEGNFDSAGAGRFTLTIYNNLDKREREMFGDLPVPGRSVRLICEGRCGATLRTMDTILRQTPMSYDSMSAGRSARLGVGTASIVRMESRDPYVNRIRSNGDLELPGENGVRFLGHGSAQAPHDLVLGGMNLRNQSEERVRQANQASGGSYEVGGPIGKTPEFDSSRFKFPEQVSEVVPGTYVFGGIDYQQYIPQPIPYNEETTVMTPTGPETRTTVERVTRYQRVTSTYDQLTGPDGKTWVADNARVGSTRKDPPDSEIPSRPLSDEGVAQDWGYDQNDPSWQGQEPNVRGNVHEIYPKVWANVMTGQMAIESGHRVHAEGSFIVQAVGDRPPEMLFGYRFTPGGVAVQQSMRDGIKAAQDNPQNYMAVLEAEGSIDIVGGVVGYGSMVAGGNMVLKASAGLRTAPELGVLVKARSLVINPADEPEPQLPGEPVSMDYPIFREAITAFASGDWTNFDNWLDQTAVQRQGTVAQLKGVQVSGTATSYWAQLNTELKRNPAYDFPAEANAWGGGPLQLEQYVRLKEFIQTRTSGVNHGDGDLSWLDMGQHQVDAAQRLENMVSVMTQWAKSYKKNLHDYLANPEPQVPDMFYQGLLYADEDLTVHAPDKSFRLEGCMVAGRNLTIDGARSIDLVYDRDLIDDQLRTNCQGDHLKLEKIYFTLR